MIFWILLLCSCAFRPILGNDGCTFVPRNSDFEITEELLEYSITSADLAALSYEQDLVGRSRRGDLHGYDTFQVWSNLDNADLAMLASRNGVCYAVFRGTISWNVRDYLQIYSQSERSVGNCGIRRGFHRAYYAGYYDEFRAAVDECMKTSSQLIVTGQSQGGSIANVAYLDLEQYTPIAITFGALRTVKSDYDCADFSRVYRYATVAYFDKKGMYDQWVSRFSSVGKHVGQTLLLDSTARAPAAYLGLNDDRQNMNQPTTYAIHSPDNYISGLISIADTACNPIQISGWEDGHWCNYDDECDSTKCISGVCVGTLQKGEECENGFDCESHQCRYSWDSDNWHFSKVCS